MATSLSQHSHSTVTAWPHHCHGTVTALSQHGHITVTARHSARSIKQRDTAQSQSQWRRRRKRVEKSRLMSTSLHPAIHLADPEHHAAQHPAHVGTAVCHVGTGVCHAASRTGVGAGLVTLGSMHRPKTARESEAGGGGQWGAAGAEVVQRTERWSDRRCPREESDRSIALGCARVCVG